MKGFILYFCQTQKGNRILQTFVMPFYAVAKGREVGTYSTWDECQNQVKGFPGAVFKKFTTLTEAQSFISKNHNAKINPIVAYYSSKKKIKNEKKIEELEKAVSEFSDAKKTDFDFNDSSKDDLHLTAPAKVKNEAKLDKILLEFNEITEEDNELAKLQFNEGKLSSSKIPPKQNKLKRKFDFNSAKVTKMKKNEQLVIKVYGNMSFQEDSEGFVHVFTDGSCIDNGKKTARAGLGVFFNDGHPLNTARAVSGRATNNCGEIEAASIAIKLAVESNIKKLCINTDSEFLIKSVESWMAGWKRRNWTLSNGTPVKNQIQFRELDEALLKGNIYVKWNHVSAHIGIHGNECADILAKEGSDMYIRKQRKK